jgi:formate hydrogenlyase subunit 4
MTCYLTVPLLIPVLTTFPLPLGYMGDILGGAFILALASFVITVAAASTGSPYAQLGASRAKTFAAITEPVVLFVVFTVALVTGTDLPYALAKTVCASADQIVRPAQLLAAAALFMVILYETHPAPMNRDDRAGSAVRALRALPGAAALGLGDEAADPVRDLDQRLRRPWGLASDASLAAVGLAILALVGKAALLGAGIAVIDDSFAKLRLFKITEFVSAASPPRSRWRAVWRAWRWP